MGKWLERITKQDPVPLSPEDSRDLRLLAGWPVEPRVIGGSIVRRREVLIQRDGAGRIVGSLERLVEEEHLDYEG